MRQHRVNLSRGMLFAWGMLLGLIFLFAVPQKACSQMQLVYASLFRWPLSLGRSATLAARPPEEPDDVTSAEYQALLANQQELQKAVANLQARLLDAQRRNEQLTNLREKPGWENVEPLQANILPMAGTTANQLFLDRGSEEGVAVGQFILSLSERGNADESSVLGTVSEVAARTAKIRLITDKGSRVFVSVGNLTARGTMEGLGNRVARVTMISREYKVDKGDPVYTEKRAGLDVPVITARVVSCQPDRDNPLFWDIRVEPVGDITTLSAVDVAISVSRPQ